LPYGSVYGGDLVVQVNPLHAHFGQSMQFLWLRNSIVITVNLDQQVFVDRIPVVNDAVAVATMVRTIKDSQC